MTIVKWQVSQWARKPTRHEFLRETECYYIRPGSQRREAKKSSYYEFFDTEADALAFIDAREARDERAKEIAQIKFHAVELLDALEGMVEYFPEGHSDGECFSIDAARAVIAKARGAA